jgi:microcin C transport system substrate-binding protein
LTIEFLLSDPITQPHTGQFVKNLGILGIDATMRLVDPVQYHARTDEFDFDLTGRRYAMGSTPGEGLKSMFSSTAAATKGSQNLTGVADPAIDALLDKIVAAKSRDELHVACRAFDRVFRAGRYWVPQWHKPAYWFAYWDVFDHPSTKPRYGRGVPDTWWYNPQKAAKIDRI